eukprot:7269193-Karenia_brevis.AAC.1
MLDPAESRLHEALDPKVQQLIKDRSSSFSSKCLKTSDTRNGRGAAAHVRGLSGWNAGKKIGTRKPTDTGA